mmetsp:Transcript_22561/g.34489  ORF Transcript_22561/g.34489 Transcript_22561/m.34489 type:complete len:174 (-) Transcript_22561:1929-2450(-)
MNNFIDKVFTVIAEIILKIVPASFQEKKAFIYYRAGMSAESKGWSQEALKNYFKSLEFEEDPIDRSFTLYNIALIYQQMGIRHLAVRYYNEALIYQPTLSQALNNLGLIYHEVATLAENSQGGISQSYASILYNRAADYWIKAIQIAPDSYPYALNWLITTERMNSNLEQPLS